MGFTESVTQASSGAVAAIVTTVALYPLDLIKTRLNNGVDEGGVPYAGPLDVLQREYRKKGFLGLYRGIQVKLMQDVARSFSFFYVFTFLKEYVKRRKGPLGFGDNLLVGYFSASANLMLTMPVEVANTRMMTGAAAGGVFAIWADLIKSGGWAKLYTGLAANLVLCLNPAIKHMVFDQVRDRILWMKGSTRLSTLHSFLLGAIATVIASTATFPAARCRAILQCRAGKSDMGGARAVVMELIKRGGILELYKGLGPQLVKGVLSSALLLATKEHIHTRVRRLVQLLILSVMLLTKPPARQLPWTAGAK